MSWITKQETRDCKSAKTSTRMLKKRRMSGQPIGCFKNKVYFCTVKQYGLIGNPLSHSWSQRWFEQMFAREGIADTRYNLYEMPTLIGLRQWVADNDIRGFNVTIPHKEAVLPYLDELDQTASAIGAVNCVEVTEGRLIGHNTDAPAFLSTLQPMLQPHHTAALILGTGGAAHAVAYALGQLGIAYRHVSRQPERHHGAIGYSEALQLASSHHLIVNATPVGMYPHVEKTPWQMSHLLGSKHLCYDLIYNPSETLFLCEAKAAGAQTCGGLAMLERQALLSWNIWEKLRKEI